MNLRQLEYLVAVADTGSLTAAAERCHVSQSAVSLGIVELESALRLRLLIRGPGRGAVLTDAGREVVAEARAVLTAVSELGAGARRLGQDVAGILRIGCYTPLAALCLPAAIAGFRAERPEVAIEFVEGSLPDLQRQLLDGRCELAFLYQQDILAGVEVSVLTNQHPHALLPSAHRLGRRRSVALRELADEPFILLDVPPSEHYFRSVFTACDLPMPIAHRAASFELARAMVARGIGYTLSVQRPVVSRSVEGIPFRTVPLRDTVPTTPLVLARAAGGRLTRRAEIFAAYCKELFGRSVSATSRRAV